MYIKQQQILLYMTLMMIKCRFQFHKAVEKKIVFLIGLSSLYAKQKMGGPPVITSRNFWLIVSFC